MKKTTFIASLLAAALMLPTFAAFAQQGTQATGGGQGTAASGGGQATGGSGSGQVTIGSDAKSGGAGGITNPLKGVDSLAGFLYLIANFVYSLSYAVIAFFLILSGFKFVKAQGNPEELTDAKRTFYYTIIGAVLLIGAQVITEVVRNVINQFAKNPI